MSVDRLTAEDQLMLAWDDRWPQDVGALALLDGSSLIDPVGGIRLDAVRAAIESRLHLVPRSRQLIHYPRRGLGGPFWLDAPDFDLGRHVQVLPLPADSGETTFLNAVERLRRQRLDRSRPLWELWLLPGLSDGRVGLFVRMHHAIGDGRAALSMLAAFLDADPAIPAAPAPWWTPEPPPSARQLLGESVLRRLTGLAGALSVFARPRTTARQVLDALPAARELLADNPAPKTSLDRVVGPDRNLAVIRSGLADVRRIARSYDATVNDVLLAATAGGLRALLRSRGEQVDGLMVPIYVPVSLRRRLRGPVQGNLIAQMVVPLCLGVSDPGERLRQIAAETVQRKARSRTSLGTMFRGRIASRLLLKAIKRQRVNLTSASLPGPRRPLYLAGAQMLEVFPMLNLIGWVALGVGALTYAGRLDVCIIADRDAYPDIDIVAAGVRGELEALRVTTPSGPLASLDAPQGPQMQIADRAFVSVGRRSEPWR